MDIFLTLLCSLLAAFGGFLIGDFIFWEVKGTKTTGRIEGFRGQLDKGAKLPVVRFLNEKGEEVISGASQIDQLMYLIGRPDAGVIIPLIYRQEGTDLRIRVYGFFSPVTGAFFILPLIVILGVLFGQGALVQQGTFFIVFLALMIGGAVALKLVQRLY